MKSALLNSENQPVRILDRAELASGHTESWLQALIFENPDIVPLDEIDPGAGIMVPLVRELALPKAGAHVFLDVLGVSPNGRLILIECKLWRNPQARREVVAQIVEYAALLRRWSYADLTAQLKARHGFIGENPIYDRCRVASSLGEADFTDQVAKSLRTGDFDLIVAGDGIREDMSAISEYLRDQGARLALVEFQVWSDGKDARLVVPSIPFRTEVHRQRLLVSSDGMPVELDNGDDEREMDPVADPGNRERKARNREFWQRFIDEVTFDHPEQARPRHGGNNWVRISLPGGARLTAYRTQDLIGFFIPIQCSEAILELVRDEQEIRKEMDNPRLRFHHSNDVGKPTVALDERLEAFATEEAQLDWLKDKANQLVNALRPRLDDR